MKWEPAETGKCYVIGEMNNIGWTGHSGKELSKIADKKFGGVIFTTSADAYISLTTLLGHGWGGTNGFRFGPTTANASIANYSNFTNCTSYGNENNFKVPTAGYYTVETDLTTASTPKAKIAAMDLYMLGNINDQGWAANVGTKMTQSGTTYTLSNVYIQKGAKFSFSAKLASSANDYASIDGFRLASNAGGNTWNITDSHIGTAQTSLGSFGENTSKDFYMDATTGYYDVTVNLSAGTLTLSKSSAKMVYVFDSTNPYLQATNSSGTKLNGDENYGSLMGNLVTVGNVDWYTWANTTGANPANITLRHANISKSGITQTGSDIYYIWNEEDATYEAIDASTATKVRRITVNVKMISDTESAPTLKAVDNNNTSKVEYDGAFPGYSYTYGSKWWKKTLIVYDKLNLTINGTTTAYTFTESGVGEDVYYEYKNGNLTKLDEAALKADAKYTGVTIHLAVKGKVKENSAVEIDTWGIDTNVGSSNYGNIETVTYTTGEMVPETADGIKWYTWTVEPTIVSARFKVDGTWSCDRGKEEVAGMVHRKSGVVWFILEEDGTLTDMTRTEEGYEVSTPDCAAMMGTHHYIYYTDVKHWDETKIYAYMWRNSDPKDIAGSTWPGVKMFKVGYDNGNPVYGLDLTALGFTDDNLPDWIIFNDGNTDNNSNDKAQTSDIVYADCASYDYLGSIYAGNTLAGLIQYAVLEGPEYKVFNDLVVVYYDELNNHLYARDLDLFAKRSVNNKRYDDNGTDRLKVDLVTNHSHLMEKRGNVYDQSNWVCIRDVDGTTASNLNLSSYKPTVNDDGSITCHVIAGNTLRGQMMNNVNPVYDAKSITDKGTTTFTPNTYIMPNFVDQYIDADASGSLVASKDFKWFFTAPKPQEYAIISWAIWDKTDKTFYVPMNDGFHTDKDDPAETGYYHNEWDLKGKVNVDWSLYNYKSESQTMPSILNNDDYNHQSFQFPAIIRYNEASASSGAPRRASSYEPVDPKKDFSGMTTKYTVFPLAIDAETSIITAIEEVKSDATVESVRYYNLMGAGSDRAFDGVNIVVTRYTDGTTSTVKVIK